ncbi:MAG: phosphatidylserine decarboxylase family protein [Bacillota bacterium]|nr:phosphatidylserine decarboxylase family protein [Bacillota bacterium]
MKKFAIARPGYPYVIAALVVTIFLYTKVSFLTPVFLFLTIFIAFFFRDPVRTSPQGENLILAPADGKIIKVEKIFEPNFVEGEALKVSIFLSIFNVHINRSPVKGTISMIKYIPGSFFAAYKDEASLSNEKNLIGIETEEGRFLVVQIAGLIARRILCWVKMGDRVERGMRLGMIKFGSCTELYMPLKVDLKVREGDRVRAGETVLGEI